MRPAAGYHFGAEEEALLLEHSSKASSSQCIQYYPELAHYTPAQLKQRIPAAHDSRKVYAQCDAKFALNQKSCGSCWAFSAATTFNWRLCVMSNGTYKNELISPQTLTSCTCQASFVRHACAACCPRSRSQCALRRLQAHTPRRLARAHTAAAGL